MFDLDDYVRVDKEYCEFHGDKLYEYVVEYAINEQQIKDDIVQLKDDLQNLRKLLKKDFNIYVDKDSVVITVFSTGKKISYSLN